MNCSTHPEVPAVAYCRTCGKALCASCKRDVRGVIYCENCLAQRLGDAIPATAGQVVTDATGERIPSPGLAAVLGFIPGVGAMYNGQFMKGFIHVLVFASLIWATNRADFFGIFIPFLIFYMVFDAYKTARAIELGQPLPDPFGLEQLFSGGTSARPHRPAASDQPATTTGAATGTTFFNEATDVAAPAPHHVGVPIGAVILIALGALFLLDNIGLFSFHWVGRLWPVILIVIGLWMFDRRWRGGRCC